MRPLLAVLLLLAGCNPYYDSWDYTPEVKQLAAAELHCDEEQLHVTPVPDRYGTHIFVVDGCGCTMTYQCDNHDLDGCVHANTYQIESTDASCR